MSSCCVVKSKVYNNISGKLSEKFGSTYQLRTRSEVFGNSSASHIFRNLRIN